MQLQETSIVFQDQRIKNPKINANAATGENGSKDIFIKKKTNLVFNVAHRIPLKNELRKCFIITNNQLFKIGLRGGLNKSIYCSVFCLFVIIY